MNSYQLVNRIFAGILIVIFSYSGFFISAFPEEGISCALKEKTGLDCPSCGFTRDFNSYVNGDFSNPINQNSFFVFWFFGIQFLFRIPMSFFSNYKFGRKFIIVDISISLALFLIAFIPVVISGILQGIALYS